MNAAQTEGALNLSVKQVIGTGDPFDQIMLLPLITDWQVPRNCMMALCGVDCQATISRLYVLDTPVDGHGVLGICETHHREFAKETV